MQPIGPLMIEHRLIERMIGLIEKKMREMKEYKRVQPDFIDVAVDFIQTYADRTHHGKEEDILFRDLAEKHMSAEHRRIMDELVEEHKYGRNMVVDLVTAKQEYVGGREDALEVILEKLRALANFYPEHIQKEDRVFFPSAMEYLSQEEQDAMLEECWRFDREMIHEKYKLLVERLEEKM
jgi:hemerythrin-like domain-containing protein